MNNYIETIKKLFSFSDEIVLLYENKKKLVWSNQNAECFGDAMPLYSDFNILGNKEKSRTFNCNLSFRCGKIKLKGRFVEIYEDNKIYSLAILKKSNMILNAFADYEFQEFVKYLISYQNCSLTQILYYSSLMASSKAEDEDDCYSKIVQNCLRLSYVVENQIQIMKIVDTEYEKAEEKYVDILETISIVCQNMYMNFDLERYDLKLECNFADNRLFIKCVQNEVVMLIMSLFRYLMLISSSLQISIDEYPMTPKFAEITFTVYKNGKDVDFDVIGNNQIINFNMEKFIVETICNKLNIEFSEGTDNEKIFFKLKFPRCTQSLKFKKVQCTVDYGKFSLLNKMFFEFLNKFEPDD